MFPRRQAAQLFRFSDPKLSTIEVEDGIVRTGDASFNIRDVMVGVVNVDPSPQGGVQGSAVFKTREFDRVDGLVQRKFNFTFGEGQLDKARQVAAMINGSGGTVSHMAIGDDAFRHTFFDE